MRGEVGDAADAERGGARLGHRQRVAVVEAERLRHAQAVRRRARRRADGRAGLVAQDLLRQRPGVLGIDVDGAGLERAEDDLGAAELAAVLDGHAGAAHQRRDHLAQDHRLGEALRRRRRPGRPGRLRSPPQRGEARQQRAARRRGQRRVGRRAAPAAAASAPLPVARNAVTNGSAGAAASVANGPCCTTRPARISTTTSARCAASPTSWVTTMTVLRERAEDARAGRRAARRAPADRAPTAARRAAAPPDRAAARA